MTSTFKFAAAAVALMAFVGAVMAFVGGAVTTALCLIGALPALYAVTKLL